MVTPSVDLRFIDPEFWVTLHGADGRYAHVVYDRVQGTVAVGLWGDGSSAPTCWDFFQTDDVQAKAASRRITEFLQGGRAG